MLLRPVECVKSDSSVVHAHKFATEKERKAFCMKTLDVAINHLAFGSWIQYPRQKALLLYHFCANIDRGVRVFEGLRVLGAAVKITKPSSIE